LALFSQATVEGETDLFTKDPPRHSDRKNLLDRAFKGRSFWQELQAGLTIHTSDSVALERMDRIGTFDPSVSLYCYLEGGTEAYLNDRPLDLSRRRGAPPHMVLTSINEPVSLLRRIKPGTYARKLNLKMSREWLARNGIDLKSGDTFQHLRRHEWNVTNEMKETIESLVRTAGRPSALNKLKMEVSALNLVCSAFAHLDDTTETPEQLKAADMRKIDRMEQFIRQTPGPMPTLQAIANAGGVSLSTMRRLFRCAHDKTVFEYVRAVRLDQARWALEKNGVSVADAAEIAGYRSPEGFATAFKKHLGVLPSEVQRNFFALGH